MNWNHRVVRTNDADGVTRYHIHEVYYTNGKIMGRTESPVTPYGETKKELKLTLKRMLRALEQPTIKGKG